MSDNFKIYEPSEKIRNILNDVNNYKNRIFEGAVRSGKSFWADYIALKEIQNIRSKKAKILLSGTNSGTIKQNVIGNWEMLLGVEFKIKKDLKGEYFIIPLKEFNGKLFYIRGHDKNGDDKKIQGMTLDYWYCDEATNMTEEFFNMGISRLSLRHSKSIFTCNPSSPHHYLKVNIIDKIKEMENFNFYSFIMDDNKSLDESYKIDLENAYNGVFYDRYILGKWVISEGLIYDNFDKIIHVEKEDKEKIKKLKLHYNSKIYIGIDYGTNNATTFLKFILNNGKFYLIEEYFHSGRDENANGRGKKSTSDYAEDLKKFIGQDNNKLISIFIDPSASYFIEECNKIGIHKTMKASNAVVFGIQKVQDVFEKNEIIITENCEHTIKELETYSWDERAAKLGEDKPMKVNDHCMDSLRYVIYSVLKNSVKSFHY